MIVPFETIMLFSKAILGEFNIAGGDSRLSVQWGLKRILLTLFMHLQVTSR
jgi:hypothetical protein